MAEAFASTSWCTWQWDAVLLIAKHVAALSAWGTGCSCHEEELTSTGGADCHMKGRRMQEAGKHVEEQRVIMLRLA